MAMHTDKPVDAAEAARILNALPPASTRRWVTRRKAQVVEAVRRGVLTLEEACQRYTLSTEEYGNWQTLIATHGVPGLRVTRIQHYRAVDAIAAE